MEKSRRAARSDAVSGGNAGSSPAFKLRHDCRFLGKLARFQLGVDQLAIQVQFEATATRGDQLQIGDLLFEMVQ